MRRADTQTNGQTDRETPVKWYSGQVLLCDRRMQASKLWKVLAAQNVHAMSAAGRDYSINVKKTITNQRWTSSAAKYA